jgi:hypothetical protein
MRRIRRPHSVDVVHFDVLRIAGCRSFSQSYLRCATSVRSTIADTSVCGLHAGSTEEVSPTARAIVARPRDCTMCRECVRHTEDGWDQRIQVETRHFSSMSHTTRINIYSSLRLQLKRRADHFLFSVESTGCMAPQTVVREVSGNISKHLHWPRASHSTPL